MKNYISNTVKQTILAVALIATLSGRANASDSTRSLPEVVIRYEGVRDGKPVFSVYFANNNVNPVVLSIADEDGNVLYEEKPAKGQYAKKFAVDLTGFSDLDLQVTLSDQWGIKKKTYNISSRVTVTHDLSITQR